MDLDSGHRTAAGGAMKASIRFSRRAFLQSAAAGMGSLAAGCLSFDAPDRSRRETAWPDLGFAHVGGLLTPGKGGPVGNPEPGISFPDALRLAGALNSDPALDFVLFSGDMTANAGPSDMENLGKFLGAIGRRWYAVPGASESASRGAAGKGEFLRALERAGSPASGPFWAAKAARNAWILGIDACRGDGGAGFVDPDQMDFLKAQIDSRPGNLVMALSGLPPFADGGRPGEAGAGGGPTIANAEELRFVLEAGENVKMAFSGRVSEWSVRTTSGLHVVMTPASIEGFPAFTHVRIRGRRARVSAIACTVSGPREAKPPQDLLLR